MKKGSSIGCTANVVLTDNVDETLAGLNVSGDDLWSSITRVGSSLLEEFSSTADCTGVLSVQHRNKCGADKISRGNLSSNNVEQQDIGQQSKVSQSGVEDGAQSEESIIRRSENGETVSSKSIDKASSLDSGTKDGESFGSTSDLSCGS